MKKYTIIMCLLLMTPFFASGAHVFVWNFDVLDIFYDAQVGASIDCSYWIEQTLAANGHTYVTGTTLPMDLSPYDVVIVTLGFFRC
jgi:hypothetical protein